ncbi:MAG: hypothetical protein ACHQK9_21095 [Reyranellales bacterium]
MTLLRTAAALLCLAVAGCVPPPPGVNLEPLGYSAELRHQRELDERKDEFLRQLATCESGGHGNSERPIYGGRGAYVGRFQFAPRTVINYVKQMDGRVLTLKEATALAHDYDQAAALAKYIIFDLGGISNWPLCNRRLGLAKQVAEILQS